MPESQIEVLAWLRGVLIEAGRMVLAGQDDLGRVDRKSATEIVTDVDVRVEELILTRLQNAFPDDGIEAEESGSVASRSGRTWYVDPIDGTTNFVHGYPFFCVSIGCARGNTPLFGGIFAPVLDELYLAGAGHGATEEHPRQGGSRTLPRRETVELDAALLATGFSYIRDDRIDTNARLVASFLRRGCRGLRRGGSAAIDLAHIAAGRLDGYWEVSLRPWDVAAGTLIAREAGATVTDFGGDGGRLAGQSILAAAPGLHEALLERIRQETWPLDVTTASTGTDT